MLSLDDVHVHIGKLHILQGVTLQVNAGESAALLGRNGVGKTTTLRAIMHLARKSRGTIMFDGVDLSRCEPHQVPRQGIGYVPQGRGIFPNLTVLENLNIGLPGGRDHELRVAAVHVPAGEARREAQVLVAARAEAAGAARAVQPRDPDPRADPGRRDTRPQALDPPDDLVAGRHAVAPRREIPLHDVQVGAADAAHLDPDLHFAGTGLGRRQLDERQRSGLDRGRAPEPHGAHES